LTPPAAEHAELIEALERSIEGLRPEIAPILIGELARLQVLLWTQLLRASRPDETRVAGGAPSNVLGSEWLSLEIATARFGLTRRWLQDHRRDLRRRHIISKPSRKTTLYHTRRLARFLEERSRA
jgi:hypothetical protein